MGLFYGDGISQFCEGFLFSFYFLRSLRDLTVMMARLVMRKVTGRAKINISLRLGKSKSPLGEAVKIKIIEIGT